MNKYSRINMIKQSQPNYVLVERNHSRPWGCWKSDNKLNNRTGTMTLWETKLSDELANPIRPTARTYPSKTCNKASRVFLLLLFFSQLFFLSSEVCYRKQESSRYYMYAFSSLSFSFYSCDRLLIANNGAMSPFSV